MDARICSFCADHSSRKHACIITAKMNRDQLSRVAGDRLYPSLTNPNYLVLRARRIIFRDWMRNLGTALEVLDVGGRYQPYRPLLNGKLKSYVALDVQTTEFVNVVGSGERVPFKDESFDLVIATQVFEYFQRPHKAATEVHRVLRAGGTLLISVAACAPRFVDEECWRYTPRALRSVLAPFSQITIRPEVTSLGAVCRLTNLFLHDSLKLKPLQAAHRLTLCPIMNLFGAGLESASMTQNDRWTGNYSVMAIK
jgi:SAM-dependent methyltransferase